MMTSPAATWTIIVSPVSGKRQAQQFAEKSLIPELRARLVPYELVITQHSQHAKQAAHGKQNIIVLGGDGTVNEVLSSCPAGANVGVLSQGTMNFFSVCSDLPNTAQELVDLICAKSVRPSSVLALSTTTPDNNQGDAPLVSFEAMHIGHMAFNVCQGAGEWRSTLGPMFGIMLNLLAGCAVPRTQRGTLRIWQPDGTQLVFENEAFYWIIATYRSPYNGVVGDELWVSWITQDTFPGFQRMMKFFEPQMEHFQGTSRCFPYASKASRFEFECTGEAYEELALVVDGDAKPQHGRRIVGLHRPRAWNLVAPEQPSDKVDPNKIAVGGAAHVTAKPLTKHAQQWLTLHPPPRGTHFPAPLKEEKDKQDKQEASPAGKAAWVAVLLLAVALGYHRGDAIKQRLMG